MTGLESGVVLSLTALPSAAVTLSDPVPDPQDVGPGWVAAVVFVLLFVVTILLWMSMRKQLGRIRLPDDSPEEGPDGGSEENQPGEHRDGQDDRADDGSRPQSPPA